jgi:hypothetical protein
MVVYRKGTNSTLYYRTYSVANPSEQSFSIGLSSAPTWLEIIGKPGANELILVAASGSSLRAGVWDGTSWGNSTSLESSLATSGRPFHVAYMNKSGKAMVVWSATSGAPRYATWDGTSWSASASLPGIAGGVPAGWIKVEGSPLKSSNEVLVACIGTNNQINVNNWTGSAWGTNLTVETATSGYTDAQADISYQPDGNQALVVWHASGQTALRYRTWSSGAWSSQQSGPDMLTKTDTIHLVRGYNSSEIMMLARRKYGCGMFNIYSQNGTVTTNGATLTGSVGSGGGYSLPTPPSGSAGTTNITMANSTTQTVSPGSYAAISGGDNDTVNLSAGTYVFTSWNFHNFGAFNFNTSGGAISIIITTGGFTINDSNTLTNSGSAPVQIHILGGNLSVHDSNTFSNVEFLVYNGTATFHDANNGSVDVFASGNISFHTNGTISGDAIGSNQAEACSAVLWTAGSPGSRSDLSTSIAPPGVAEPCDLAGSPMPASTALSSWAAVAP